MPLDGSSPWLWQFSHKCAVIYAEDSRWTLWRSSVLSPSASLSSLVLYAASLANSLLPHWILSSISSTQGVVLHLHVPSLCHGLKALPRQKLEQSQDLSCFPSPRDHYPVLPYSSILKIIFHVFCLLFLVLLGGQVKSSHAILAWIEM